MAEEKKPTGTGKSADSSKAAGAAKKSTAKAASAKKTTTAKAPAKTVQRVRRTAKQTEQAAETILIQKEEKRMSQEALGMVETRGLVASIEAADTMFPPLIRIHCPISLRVYRSFHIRTYPFLRSI